MSKKINKVTDLMPKVGKNLIAYTGKEVLERVGTEIIKNVITSTLSGENIRHLTESLTKRRIEIINGSLFAMFLKGSASIEDFQGKITELVRNQSKLKNTKEEKSILLWMVGLTGKGVQNILRGEASSFESYLKKLKNDNKELSDEFKTMFGDLQGNLTLDGNSANVDWGLMLPMMRTIGTQTVAIRGAEKSMYGKLFERLILGCCLTILGYKLIKESDSKKSDCVFWLSSRGDKRESDATILHKAGQGARFDIGFIGPGNTEISLDKVSRFQREFERGRQTHFMGTFIIVDRIGAGSRIVELAKKIDGTIIQMSMAFWIRELAKKLSKTFNCSYSVTSMSDAELQKHIKSRVGAINLQDFMPD